MILHDSDISSNKWERGQESEREEGEGEVDGQKKILCNVDSLEF